MTTLSVVISHAALLSIASHIHLNVMDGHAQKHMSKVFLEGAEGEGKGEGGWAFVESSDGCVANGSDNVGAEGGRERGKGRGGVSRWAGAMIAHAARGEVLPDGLLCAR